MTQKKPLTHFIQKTDERINRFFAKRITNFQIEWKQTGRTFSLGFRWECDHYRKGKQVYSRRYHHIGPYEIALPLLLGKYWPKLTFTARGNLERLIVQIESTEAFSMKYGYKTDGISVATIPADLGAHALILAQLQIIAPSISELKNQWISKTTPENIRGLIEWAVKEGAGNSF